MAGDLSTDVTLILGCPRPAGAECEYPTCVEEGHCEAGPYPGCCDDAEVMRIWREVGLPEYFLGNGGANHKLVAFAARIREAGTDV
jgi:hypothetical protein